MEHLGTSDAVETYWNAALPHLQAHYCHSTLGTKIHIETLGFKHYEGRNLTASSQSLNDMWSTTFEDRGNADLIVYMCNDTTVGGAVGIAVVGSACNPNSSGQMSINEWRTTASSFGFVRQFSAVISFFYLVNKYRLDNMKIMFLFFRS